MDLDFSLVGKGVFKAKAQHLRINFTDLIGASNVIDVRHILIVCSGLHLRALSVVFRRPRCWLRCEGG
jgi:hypothetical protein